MIWLAIGAASAGCAEQTPTAEVTEDILATIVLLEDRETERFRDNLTRLRQTVPCTSEPLTADSMVGYRLMLGVDAFIRTAPEEAAAEFLAARAIRSDATIPLYPREHEIYGVYKRHDPVRAEVERLRKPRKGELLFDGVPSRVRYLDAPALMHHVVDGTVVSSQPLAPGERPVYPRKHPLRTGLLVGAGGLAIASAGSLGAAAASRSQFFAGDKQFSELSALKSRTNALAWTGYILGGAALATGASAAVFGKF